MQPTRAELRQAFEAGFQSIDEGDSFYTRFSCIFGVQRLSKTGRCPLHVLRWWNARPFAGVSVDEGVRL